MMPGSFLARCPSIHPHAFEPRQPVGVRQRHAGVHLGDIGLRMERVAFLKRPSEPRRKFFGNG